MKRTQTLPKWDVKFKKLNFWSNCSKFHKCGWSQCYSLSTPTCETCRIEQGCDTIPLTQNCKTVSRLFVFTASFFPHFSAFYSRQKVKGRSQFPFRSPVGDFRLHQQIEDDRQQVVGAHGFYAHCGGRHTVSEWKLKSHSSRSSLPQLSTNE